MNFMSKLRYPRFKIQDLNKIHIQRKVNKVYTSKRKNNKKKKKTDSIQLEFWALNLIYFKSFLQDSPIGSDFSFKKYLHKKLIQKFDSYIAHSKSHRRSPVGVDSWYSVYEIT